MERRALLGIIGGLIVFSAIFSYLYIQSDFDRQLIDQVDNGVPVDELNIQIDHETKKLEINAQRHLNRVVMDPKYWGNGSLASPKDYEYYTKSYETELKIIIEYDNIRKKFVKHEITKQEFINSIRNNNELLYH